MNRQTKLIVGIIGGVVLILLCLFFFLRTAKRFGHHDYAALLHRALLHLFHCHRLYPQRLRLGQLLPIEDLENLAASALSDYLRNPIHRKE